MTKLLLILILGGAFADQLATSRSDPPLLIDASPAPTSTASLDVPD
ncbi:hypothetical protein [Sphingomonas sp.]|nr:hypothetical protein [Sphingomonas sp.]